MSDSTSITCNKNTKKRAESYGKMSETWDDLLNRIMDEAGVPKDE